MFISSQCEVKVYIYEYVSDATCMKTPSFVSTADKATFPLVQKAVLSSKVHPSTDPPCPNLESHDETKSCKIDAQMQVWQPRSGDRDLLCAKQRTSMPVKDFIEKPLF
jgi:hypothetical protein